MSYEGSMGKLQKWKGMKILASIYLFGSMILMILFISKAFCFDLEIELNKHEIERQIHEKQHQYQEYDRQFFSLFEGEKDNNLDRERDQNERD